MTVNQDAITRAFGVFDPQAIASFQTTRQLTSGTSALSGDALAQLFGFNLLTYGFGLTLNLPIKNRAAAANLADAAVNKKMDALRVGLNEQTVRLQVLTALTGLQNTKASVELAQKRVEAEQKKCLETEQIFFVLTAEGDLSTAESVLVNQMINYRLNQSALPRALGTLLDERGVAIQ